MGNEPTRVHVRPLSEQEMNLLSSTSGMSRDQVLAWHKQFVTQFPEGIAQKSEFVETYKRTFAHGNAEKFALFAKAAFDEDRNGRIAPGEFILATAFVIKPNATRAEKLERLKLAFEIFDVDLILIFHY
jgi:Ca2+-binding EF-hand superfamily protein